MITILTDVKDLDLNGQRDVRSFTEGEIHELSDANEMRLIDLGLAEPTMVIVEPLAVMPAVETDSQTTE